MDSIPDISAVTPGGDSGSSTRRSRTPFPDPNRDASAQERPANRDSAGKQRTDASVARTASDAAPTNQTPRASDANAPIGPDGKPYKGIDLWV